MGNDQIRSLLQQTREASDRQQGLLYSYGDLQDVLRQLSVAAEELLVENHRLEERLRRGTAFRAGGGPVLLSCRRD